MVEIAYLRMAWFYLKAFFVDLSNVVRWLYWYFDYWEPLPWMDLHEWSVVVEELRLYPRIRLVDPEEVRV